MCREVDYSAKDLLSNINNCGHRKIIVLRDGIVAFTFTMLGNHFLLRQLIFFLCEAPNKPY